MDLYREKGKDFQVFKSNNFNLENVHLSQKHSHAFSRLILTLVIGHILYVHCYICTYKQIYKPATHIYMSTIQKSKKASHDYHIHYIIQAIPYKIYV